MADGIIRNVNAASETDAYDVIIVGGGIHGAMLQLEACRRGLKTLLLEKRDFGAATSFNSLRTVHGGLRYLQSANFRRFFESVAERSWFLRTFPDIVRPLPCLMPLYDEGLRRRSVMRLALLANDLLAWNRNAGVPVRNRLPSGTTIDAESTRALLPAVRSDGLTGGAIWYDAIVPDSQRLVMESLHLGAEAGGTALNYVGADELLTSNNRVAGVRGTDMETGKRHDFRSNAVINAAGPWCREVARSFDRDVEALFYPSIAWNVLFDRGALSSHAVAVAPPGAGAQVYFAHPWKGRLLVGTGHGPWSGGPDDIAPTREQLDEFIDDLNEAVPELGLTRSSISHVFAGLLPARGKDDSEIATSETIVDHLELGGPSGLFSVSGVKLTTSRRVAEKTLKIAFPDRCATIEQDPTRAIPCDNQAGDLYKKAESALANKDRAALQEALACLIDRESVVHLEDLVFRRTALWEYRDQVIAAADFMADLFNWEASRRASEIGNVIDALPIRNIQPPSQIIPR